MAAVNEHGLRVLIAIDGSDYSYHAVKCYIENVYTKEDEVIFVNVLSYLLPDSAASGRGFGYELAPEVIGDLRKDMLKEFKPVEDNVKKIMHGYPVKKSEFVYSDGDAGKELCKIAKNRKASMVIMGSRGQGKLKRTILGSVSDHVLHKSPCPVIISKLNT